MRAVDRPPPPLASRAPLVVCLALALGLTGCGPTDEEVARSVLFVTPVPFVVGTGILVGLARLWRKLRPVEVELRVPLFAGGFILCVSGLSLFAMPAGRAAPAPSAGHIVDLSLVVLWLWGTSFVAIHLATWRVWFAIRPRTAWTWAWVLPVTIGFVPAAPLVLGLTPDLFKPAAYVWGWAGGMGIATGIVFVLLLTEVLVRIMRAKPSRQPSPSPQPLPSREAEPTPTASPSSKPEPGPDSSPGPPDPLPSPPSPRLSPSSPAPAAAPTPSEEKPLTP